MTSERKQELILYVKRGDEGLAEEQQGIRTGERRYPGRYGRSNLHDRKRETVKEIE